MTSDCRKRLVIGRDRQKLRRGLAISTGVLTVLVAFDVVGVIAVVEMLRSGSWLVALLSIAWIIPLTKVVPTTACLLVSLVMAINKFRDSTIPGLILDDDLHVGTDVVVSREEIIAIESYVAPYDPRMSGIRVLTRTPSRPESTAWKFFRYLWRLDPLVGIDDPRPQVLIDTYHLELPHKDVLLAITDWHREAG